ncbi:MAG: glycosyltransferase family 4 protein [Cyclonatronaceae bacterium]
MKILYITQYFPPETGAGATRAQAITQHFAERGWQVDVLCEFPSYPTGKVSRLYRGKWRHSEIKNGIHVQQVWVYATARENMKQQLLLFGSFVFSSLWHLIRHPRQYDLIYVSSPPISAALTGAVFSRLSGIPWVFEVRDLWPDAGLGSGLFRSKTLFYRFSKALERWLYKSATLTVLVTEAAEEIVKQTQPDSHTFVVHNGADETHFFPGKVAHAPVKELEKAPGKFRVGYVGSVGIIHDLEAVIKAAVACQHDPDIEFVIIGDGSQRHRLNALIEQYKPDNLRWIGLKPHAHIPDYINTFDVGLNPVHNVKAFESIVTVKFYEYLACSVPVITLGSGTLAEIGARSKAAITLPPGDFRGMAETILDLKARPERLRSLKQAARPFIEQHFSRKRLSERLARRLEAILAEKHPPE